MNFFTGLFSKDTKIAALSLTGLGGCINIEDKLLDIGLWSIIGYFVLTLINYVTSWISSKGFFDKFIDNTKSVYKILGGILATCAVVWVFIFDTNINDGLEFLYYLIGIPMFIIAVSLYYLPNTKHHRRWVIQTVWTGLLLISLLYWLVFYANDYFVELMLG